jgi:hypothetical protein
VTNRVGNGLSGGFREFHGKKRDVFVLDVDRHSAFLPDSSIFLPNQIAAALN